MNEKKSYKNKNNLYLISVNSYVKFSKFSLRKLS